MTILKTRQWMAETSVRLRWVDHRTLDPKDRVRPPDGRRSTRCPGSPTEEASDSGSEGWGFESLSGYAWRVGRAVRLRLAKPSTGLRSCAGSIPALSASSRCSSVGQSVALIRRRPVVRVHPARLLFPWRSWTARDATNVEVAGSNPAGDAPQEARPGGAAAFRDVAQHG